MFAGLALLSRLFSRMLFLPTIITMVVFVSSGISFRKIRKASERVLAPNVRVSRRCHYFSRWSCFQWNFKITVVCTTGTCSVCFYRILIDPKRESALPIQNLINGSEFFILVWVDSCQCKFLDYFDYFSPVCTSIPILSLTPLLICSILVLKKFVNPWNGWCPLEFAKHEPTTLLVVQALLAVAPVSLEPAQYSSLLSSRLHCTFNLTKGKNSISTMAGKDKTSMIV